jgi:hypothetical protein
MQSPFPGMDPYIEQHGLWPDFHDDLIAEIKRFLASVVPERYVVRTGERSYVVLAESEGKDEHAFVPDLGVTSTGRRGRRSSAAAPASPAETSAHDGPVQMLALIEERYRENFIEIYEAQGEQRLVTTLEVLSPANKRRGTEGWDLYLRKRQALLLGAANLVEIDLLRQGQRMPMVTPWPAGPYYLLGCCKRRAPYCSVWPATFQERLPTVLLPLEDPDPDISLDLQPMVEAIYARSRYDTSIDYTKPLTPPLLPVEAAWVAERLQPSSPTRPGTARRRRRR